MSEETRTGEDRGRQLELLEEITTLVGRTEDYQEALEGVVRLLANATDCEVCSLYSYDPATDSLTLAATAGFPTRAIGRVTMQAGEGLVGLVAKQGEPVAVEDALAHPAFKFFPELGEEKYHGFLGVPVGAREGLLGVLVLQSRRRRRFLDDDIRLVRAVAGHVRALMVNAHLAERLQREEEEREVYRRNMVRAIRRLEGYEAARRRRAQVREPRTPPGGVRLSGQGASPGFGIGRVHLVLPPADLDHIEIRDSEDAELELKRFEEALAASKRELEEARQHMRQLVPEVGGAIYEALAMLIDDRSFSEAVRERIKEGKTAESALKLTVDSYTERFAQVDDHYLRDRAYDVREVGQRILRHLLGVDQRMQVLDDDAVLVAPELTLSDLAAVDHTRLRGIVTASGGVTSHAAILAKSLEIPTVVGVENLVEVCHQGDEIIVDGNTGTVYVRPSLEVTTEYRRLETQFRAFQRDLADVRNLPAETLDGYRIPLYANIGLLGELDFAELYGAEGIGLFRTELPFLSYRDFPSEEEQVRLYRSVIERMGDRPVTIRTLDLAADKYPSYVRGPKEDNPFLGWRSIRVSLECETIFQEQIRAILRAADGACLRIMFPMVTSLEEVRRVREIYADCVADLTAAGYRPPQDVELGIMIEVPAAVLRAPQLLREVDFASIGTNDLIQYTLAVDRDNRKVAFMYEPLHPAVLQSIKLVVDAARETGRRVAMCGEMAANPAYTLFLLGVGLDELSMSAIYIPVVKKLIRAVRMSDAETIARDLLRYDTIEEVKGHLFSCLRELGLIELVEAFN
ncbi:MAG: phosphoenolpyruvate--protein phosphotransferase [Candidatus Dadabacteria bacterium]|nr:MAG: phosphoenolpyruvate--protein phosphotransferase [Candidatus Dadabacteria bacterium]